jgi:CRISPR-associated protein Csh2
MDNVIKNRSEVLFMYDVTYANPNGDPNDENKPRIDEETGINIVTDVRLKRTIRDYLDQFKGLDIFIKEIREDDGNLKTKEKRLSDYKNDPNEILRNCIDIRLFGATLAIQDKTITLTGPVQFNFGHSLHRVNLQFVKGTTVMPSGEGRAQGTMTERYILPYSFIVFYGVINENTAKTQQIPLTPKDIDLMLEAMWYGTINLTTGSKFGHMPRFLMQIIYKEGVNYHIGELDRLIKMESDVEDEEIREISQFTINFEELIKKLSKKRENIELVRLCLDERLRVTPVNLPQSILSMGIKVENFPFNI